MHGGRPDSIEYPVHRGAGACRPPRPDTASAPPTYGYRQLPSATWIHAA